jgi:FG-GAP repeat.
MGKFIRRAVRVWLLAFPVISLLSWIALPCMLGEATAASHAAESSRASTIQAIGIDGTGVGQGFDNAGISSISWPHTVGTGTSRVLIVGVSTTVTVLPAFPAARVRETPPGVTYGGTALTRIGTRLSPNNFTAVEMFILVNPPSGTANISVTFLPLAANYAVGGSASFTGVNQTMPTGVFTSNANTDNTPTVTVADSNTGDVVIDTLGADFNIAVGISPGPGQTERWRGDFGGTFHIGAGSTETASSPVTMSWTTSAADDWALGAVALRAATPTAITADISGRVTNSSGSPVAGVALALLDIETSQNRIAVTGVDGRYRFNAAQVGDEYIITPARAGYSFNPSNHFFSHTGELTGLDFIATNESTIPRAVFNDFDGDGKSDLAIFRATDATWYIRHSSDNSIRAERFGLSDDRLVPADYDGDGRTDIAVFRQSNGRWYVMQSESGALRAEHFGQAGDVPVAADYDADGKADFAVFRAGVWHIMQSANHSHRTEQFGFDTDLPLLGDYDGDGKADLAVFRAGAWYLKSSASGSVEARLFGLSTDRTVAADYDGDAKADVAVFREGAWYIQHSASNIFRAERFGLTTDALVAGDYDGDGRADLAVFREGIWYIMQSSTNQIRVEGWGMSGDVPVRTSDAP